MSELLVRVVSSLIPFPDVRRRFRRAHMKVHPSDYEGVFGVSRSVRESDRPGPHPVRSGSETDVSVIIPVYNVAPYLGDCLESVRKTVRILTDDDKKATVEVILVDDGSTDASGRILDEFATGNNGQSTAVRFRVVHQPNAGVSAARNRGINEAGGQIIVFLDADDTFAPESLKLIWQTACAEGPDLIRYEWKLVRDHREDVSHIADDAPVEVFSANTIATPLHQAKCGAFVVISRFLADKLRWPLVSHGEDPLFLLDCLHESRKSVVIRAPLANYLVRPDSASHAVPVMLYLRTLAFANLAVGKLSAWDEWPGIREDTCEWVCHAMFRVMFGRWRQMPEDAREPARAAYWRELGALAAHERLFDEGLRRRCLHAVRRRSALLLLLTVVLPYRWGWGHA